MNFNNCCELEFHAFPLKERKVPVSFQHYKTKEEAFASSLVLLLNCLQSTGNFLDFEDFQEISDLDIVVGFE